MGKELELLLAVARVLEPLHPTLTPLINEIDPPADGEKQPEAGQGSEPQADAAAAEDGRGPGAAAAE